MAAALPIPNIAQRFAEFAKFGDAQSDGKGITLKNADKWMKQANVFTKTFTTTDTGICFAKFKTKQMDQKVFLEYVADLCKTKNMNTEEFVKKLVSCGEPGTTNTTKAADMAVTDRLTDTSKYTGAHKERFDESGKGKGHAGRESIQKDDGYVNAYKGKDTYDKTH